MASPSDENNKVIYGYLESKYAGSIPKKYYSHFKPYKVGLKILNRPQF